MSYLVHVGMPVLYPRLRASTINGTSTSLQERSGGNVVRWGLYGDDLVCQLGKCVVFAAHDIRGASERYGLDER